MNIDLIVEYIFYLDKNQLDRHPSLHLIHYLTS
jgi:hypothetical protein